MRISDWSSDVCSSDLDPFRAEGEIGGIAFADNVQAKVAKPLMGTGVEQREIVLERAANGLLYPTDPALAAVGAPRDLKPVTREEVGASWYRGDAPDEIGRAPWTERGCQEE